MTDARFAFGANWARFLERLTPQRIATAERDLFEWLGDLRGKTFLDIGSGSGLSSLAARNLGATVVSFDYDAQSVACTAELRRRYHADEANWRVEQGSALDERYMRSLGKFDVVYSWGVLHHTGAMWKALELAAIPIMPKGQFWLAIYNRTSIYPAYRALKWSYVHLPPLRWPLLAGYAAAHAAPEVGSAVYRGRHPLSYFREYGDRGMSWWRDMVDWVGGYPYEAATAEEITSFYLNLGLTLERVNLEPGPGCNQFRFRKPQ